MVNWWFGARWFGFLGSPKMKGVVTWGYPWVIQYHQFEYLTANSEEFLGRRIILQVDVAQEVRWCPETPRGCPKTFQGRRHLQGLMFKKLWGCHSEASFALDDFKELRRSGKRPDFLDSFLSKFPTKPTFGPSFVPGWLPLSLFL